MSDVIVISKQGTQRESLDVVLRTLQSNLSSSNGSQVPSLKEIGEIIFIENLNIALACMDEKKPSLIILDANEEDVFMEKQVKQIKSQFPQVKIMVLADIVSWQFLKKMPELDGLLLKGFSSAQLTQLIKKLLNWEPSSQPGEADEHDPQALAGSIKNEGGL
jgi:DNA-binding NarL/FixJ family response regulator